MTNPSHIKELTAVIAQFESTDFGYSIAQIVKWWVEDEQDRRQKRRETQAARDIPMAPCEVRRFWKQHTSEPITQKTLQKYRRDGQLVPYNDGYGKDARYWRSDVVRFIRELLGIVIDDGESV